MAVPPGSESPREAMTDGGAAKVFLKDIWYVYAADPDGRMSFVPDSKWPKPRPSVAALVASEVCLMAATSVSIAVASFLTSPGMSTGSAVVGNG